MLPGNLHVAPRNWVIVTLKSSWYVISGVARILKSVELGEANVFYVCLNITATKYSTGGIVANN